MKRFFKICKVLTFVALSASLMASCKKESENVAKAVLGDQTILNFTAQNPVAQKVTVYSDAAWHVTAPEWIRGKKHWAEPGSNQLGVPMALANRAV